MNSQESSKPSWWVLSIVAALIIGLLMLAHRLVLSPGWRGLADVGIVFFSYGLVELWLRTNTSTLAHDHSREAKTTVIVIEPLFEVNQNPLQISAPSEPPLISNTTDISAQP